MDAWFAARDRQHRGADQRRLRDVPHRSNHVVRRLHHVQVALGPPGPRRRAKPHHGRRRRHQHREGRSLHLWSRLRHRRHRRQCLHHDRLDRADLRPALHRGYLPGCRVRRRSELARHHRIGLQYLADAVDPRILHVGVDGEGSHAACGSRNSHAAAAGAVRPQGPQITKGLEAMANRFVNRSELIGILVLAVFLVVILPLCLDVFRLNLVAKYLTYAFVALGLVICWGYGGILSLGQGVFFGLGGYCMAMFLKLEASSPENTKIQSTPGIPDFMDWNQITSLPFFWKPFHSLTFTIAAVILVPGIFALIIGAAMFKRRVGGTYFAIITQAVAAILTILIVGQQGYTGGINGMTDLRTLKGWDIRPDHAKIVLYFFEVGCLFVCIFIAQFIRHSKLGRILVAMRDKEDRVRFSGYSVANFKIFAFCVAAVFAAIGGAMFALNVGFMSPSFVGIVPSIEMVIYTAVGGRLSILGAIYGTLLVNFAKTSLSESFPELWLFGLGGLFIAVVLAFPNGLAGIWGDYVQPRIDRLIASRKPKSGNGWTDSSVADGAPAE